jgi:hypothetical protein
LTTRTQFSTVLKQARDRSYILSHPKKDTSTQNTNFFVSLSDPAAYAMLATLADPLKIPLPTITTTQGQIRQHITTLNLTLHTRNILGRTCNQLFTDPEITQLNTSLTPLRYNKTKGLTGRPIDKIAWATILLVHIDVLQAYEEGVQEQELEEPPPTQTYQQRPNLSNPSKNTPASSPPGKGKGKMPPMERHLPDPFKQMRQKSNRSKTTRSISQTEGGNLQRTR